MKSLSPILINSFVKPFYRENAGSFFFFATVMFFCVGPLNGASVVEYHYSLMMGMLKSTVFTSLVCLDWILYARKCSASVIKKQFDPQYAFIYLLNNIESTVRLRLILWLQTLLFLPVILYGIIILGVGIYHQYFLNTIILLLCMLACCFVPTVWQLYQLKYLEKRKLVSFGVTVSGSMPSSYTIFLFRYIFGSQKWIFGAIKIFSCGILVGMVLNNSPTDYEINFPFLFFNFGLMANGFIVYKLRVFEETHLLFYRNMPASLVIRWLQYALVYAILLIPEWITIFLLTPVHLHMRDALDFAIAAYGVLLLINSIYFLDDFSMKGYLRVLLVVLCIEYFFVIADALYLLYPVLLVSAAIIFFSSYYSFEKSRGQIGN